MGCCLYISTWYMLRGEVETIFFFFFGENGKEVMCKKDAEVCLFFFFVVTIFFFLSTLTDHNCLVVFYLYDNKFFPWKNEISFFFFFLPFLYNKYLNIEKKKKNSERMWRFKVFFFFYSLLSFGWAYIFHIRPSCVWKPYTYKSRDLGTSICQHKRG